MTQTQSQFDAEEAYEQHSLDNPDTTAPLVEMLCNAGLLPEIMAACREWVDARTLPLVLGGPAEAVAEARRFAAAPDLLAACEAMRTRLTQLANVEDCCWHDWDGSYAVDAALAKAKED